MIRLGRVRFEDLEEGEVLGEGTFGTVLSGMYRGRDVAVKKARGAIGSASIMEAFRSEGGGVHNCTTVLFVGSIYCSSVIFGFFFSFGVDET